MNPILPAWPFAVKTFLGTVAVSSLGVAAVASVALEATHGKSSACPRNLLPLRFAGTPPRCLEGPNKARTGRRSEVLPGELLANQG
jgi:hypothetical protein